MNKYSANVAWSQEDEAFVATSTEFPGLSGLGPTDISAVEELHVAIDLAVSELERAGQEVPEPLLVSSYSGQLRLRLPRSMHAALADRAVRDQVSLNTLIVSAISYALGCERGRLDSARAQREEIRQLAREGLRDIALLVSDSATETQNWTDHTQAVSAPAYGTSVDVSTQFLRPSFH